MGLLYVLCDGDALLASSDHYNGKYRSHWGFVIEEDNESWYLLEVELSSPLEEFGDPYLNFDDFMKKAVSLYLLGKGQNAVVKAERHFSIDAANGTC